jgi:hypothetical protein
MECPLLLLKYGTLLYEKVTTGMPKTKQLNGMPHDLVHSFFSDSMFWEKGYMIDWIVNAANELNINRIWIDIMNNKIFPKELAVNPILCQLKKLVIIINKTVHYADLPDDYIKQAYFEIDIIDYNFLKCKSTVIAKNCKMYYSQDYLEQSHNKFRALPLNSWINLRKWMNKKY